MTRRIVIIWFSPFSLMLARMLPRFTTPTGAGLVLRPLDGVASVRHVSAVMRPDRAERLAVRRVVDQLVRVGREVAAAHRG